MQRGYLDPKDQRYVFVGQGIGGGIFMSFKQRPSGSLQRVKTKYLPTRDTFEEAQADLDKWAKAKGFKAFNLE